MVEKIKRDMYIAKLALGIKNRYPKLSTIEVVEFTALVKHLDEQELVTTSHLSQYIIDSNISINFPNIAGHVDMVHGDRTWDYDGGFPSHIYRMICGALELESTFTQAKAVGFTSYANTVEPKVNPVIEAALAEMRGIPTKPNSDYIDEDDLI